MEFRRKKVMIVDDEEFMFRLLELALAPFYHLSHAKSGVEALQMVFHQQPDLVMLDICMPGLDGLDTCRLLKNAPETGHIPILMMSGLDTPKDEITALDAGADAFISKPVTAKQVQLLVDDLLCSAVNK